MRSNPQPAGSVAMWATENKQQTIMTIIYSDRVLVTGQASTPVKIFRGIAMERIYLAIHKEVDPITSQQVVDAAAQSESESKSDKNVSILLIHYLHTNKAYCYGIVLVEGTSRTRAVVDIATTARP